MAHAKNKPFIEGVNFFANALFYPRL